MGFSKIYLVKDWHQNKFLNISGNGGRIIDWKVSVTKKHFSDVVIFGTVRKDFSRKFQLFGSNHVENEF